MTPRDFLHWLRAARKGQTVTYHTGNLQFDRQDTNNPNRPHVDRIGQMAMNASKNDEAQLAQKRVEPGVCRYIARRL